jgi:hypothetical protein
MNVQLEAMGLEMPVVEGHPNRLPFHGVLTLVAVPSRRSPGGALGHRVMLTRKATEAALPSLLGMALDYAPGLNSHDVRRKIGVITEAEIVSRWPVASGQWSVGGSEVAQGLKPGFRAQSSAGLKSCPDTGHSNQQTILLGGEKPHISQKKGYVGHSNVGHTVDRGGQVVVKGHLFEHDFPDVVEELLANEESLGMSYEITPREIVGRNSAIWTVTAYTFTGAAVLRREKAAYPETGFGVGISHKQ